MKKLAIAILACSFAAACSTVNTVERANPQSVKKMVDDKRVITDDALDRYAYVAGVNESFVSGNLLKIQVELVNSGVAYRSVNYKFTWIDENGMEIESATAPWGTVVLEGGESKFISAVASSPKIKDFKLKLLPNMR